MVGIKERCGLRRRDTVETQPEVWEEFQLFQGKNLVEDKEDALRTAMEWHDRGRTIWTDGSGLEHGRVGAAIAFWDEERGEWFRRGFLLGDNKEVFDAEVFALLRAVKSSMTDNRQGKHI